ncbi:MAG: helix-turn-helix domain-containing protein [Opitutales bacterium]
MTIGRIIAEARKTAGLTQRQLAELSGVGTTAIWQLENNRVTARFATIQAVCRVLNIRLQAHLPHRDASIDLT